jgi:DNA (cytosine-5)-methyltransferase 1
MKENKPTFVDLFAGSGGLSLGLEQAGFEPIFVNELNSDALETYLMNRDGHTQVNLRETMRQVSDIMTISQDAEALSGLKRFLKKKHGEISLVVGGPPCQGFSGIGHRRTFQMDREGIPSNHLYREMAKVVEELQPRMFLFENVGGLLSSRWFRDGGEKGEIWHDVRRTFAEIGGSAGKQGYEFDWQLVRAGDYGVAQNRPRVLLVGIREDLKVAHGLSNVARGFLPAAFGQAPDLIDLLGDLVDPSFTPGETRLSTTYSSDALTDIQWHLREGRHGQGRGKRKAGMSVTEMQYSRHKERVIARFEFMLRNDGEIYAAHQTKKFAQRLLPTTWKDGKPSITATSLPDDYVHFSQPRTPTVREWARLQMFPDWYQFAGKRTTGGRRRAGNPESGDWAREVPKYTQIGNAVPVELARRVGEHLKLLDSGRYGP